MTELVYVYRPINADTGVAGDVGVMFTSITDKFQPYPQIGSIDIHPKTQLHFYRQAANHPAPPIDAKILRLVAERIEQLNLKP